MAEGPYEESPDYTSNETARRQQLLDVAVQRLGEYLAEEGIDSATADDAWLAMTVHTQDLPVATRYSNNINDPVKHLTAQATIARRAHDEDSLYTVCAGVVDLLQADEGLARRDTPVPDRLKDLLDISIALGTSDIFQFVADDVLRDTLFAAFALRTDNAKVIGRIQHASQYILTFCDFVLRTDAPVEEWEAFLPNNGRSRDNILNYRAEGRNDLAAALRIGDPVIRASATLSIADEKGHPPSTDGVLASLRQACEGRSLTGIDVQTRIKYLYMSGDEEALNDLRTMAQDDTLQFVWRARASAAVAGWTNDCKLAEEVSRRVIADLREEGADASLLIDFDDGWQDLALGLNDPNYALRISDHAQRDQVLLRLVRYRGSLDPILFLDDPEEQEALRARYFVEQRNLREIKLIRNQELYDQAITDVALRWGDPSIAVELGSDIAPIAVMASLQNPEAPFLMSLGRIPTFMTPAERVDIYGKHYRFRNTDIDILEPMEEFIMAQPMVERRELFRAMAYHTNNVVYAYKALEAWLKVGREKRGVEWGAAILDTIYTLSTPGAW
jgi:hypothetical protein